jgi:hypothetical protein
MIGGGAFAWFWLALAALALRPAAPVIAQEPPTEEMLIERLRQIQDALTAGAKEPGQVPETGLAQEPPLGEDEVRTLVSEGLGVDVLSIEVVERDGEPAYAVTVMNPPGNTNGAFAVETLLVDGATGGLLERVPQRPRVAAPNLAGPSGASDPERSGMEIRRRTYR